MIYQIGMLCKHFKGKGLEDKNIYRIIKLGVEGKDINPNEITYTGDGELMTASNLVVYANIFQNNKLFAREYEDISGELSPEKQQQFNQIIKVQPLNEDEIEIVNSPKFIEIKEMHTREKFQ
ncbi:MAG: hypothetical protein E7378_03075 [Clostridiales bacterium]|nr:hypothetical protein [Clostridiales bacterium]